MKKWCSIIICYTILLFSNFITFSQPQKVFGVYGFNSAIYLDNKIYASTYDDDFRLFCLDTIGNILWQRGYGGSQDDKITNIYHVNENGFDYLLLCGYTFSFENFPFPPYNQKGYVIKTNMLGDTIWTRVYDRSIDINFCLANDSNYIFSQFTGFGSIIKVDRNTGDTLWTHKNIWQVSGVKALVVNLGPIYNSCDGFYVGGTTYPFNNAKIMFMKTDMFGHALWVKAYGDSIPNIGRGISTCSNGDFVLFGQSAPDGMDTDTLSYHDINILRVNLNGDTIWTKRYCHLNWPDRPKMVIQTNDNGFLILGSTINLTLFNSDQRSLIIKIDSLGNLMWAKTYIGEPRNCLSATNTGYLFVEGYMHLIDSLGNDCSAQNANVTVAHSQITIDSITPYDSSGLEFYMSPPTQEFTSNVPIFDYCLWLNTEQQSSSLKDFKVVPNPATTMVYLEMGVELKDYDKLKVYDVYGKTVFRKNILYSDRKSIDVQKFNNGMYLFVLEDGKGNSVSKKVLINK